MVGLWKDTVRPISSHIHWQGGQKDMSRPRQFSDLRVGEKVLVEVELVFDEGLVVSCGSEGGSFCARGVLLLVPALNKHPDLNFKDQTLAPPLPCALTRGHLYASRSNRASVTNYGRRLLTIDIPNCLTRDKKCYEENPPCRIDKPPCHIIKNPPGYNLVAIGKRRDQLVKQILEMDDKSSNGKFCKWRAGEVRKPTVVNAVLPKSPSMDREGRQAKKLASQNIGKIFEYYSNGHIQSTPLCTERPKAPIRTQSSGRPPCIKLHSCSPAKRGTSGVGCRLGFPATSKGVCHRGRNIKRLRNCSVNVTKLKVNGLQLADRMQMGRKASPKLRGDGVHLGADGSFSEGHENGDQDSSQDNSSRGNSHDPIIRRGNSIDEDNLNEYNESNDSVLTHHSLHSMEESAAECCPIGAEHSPSPQCPVPVEHCPVPSPRVQHWSPVSEEHCPVPAVDRVNTVTANGVHHPANGVFEHPIPANRMSEHPIFTKGGYISSPVDAVHRRFIPADNVHASCLVSAANSSLQGIFPPLPPPLIVCISLDDSSEP